MQLPVVGSQATVLQSLATHLTVVASLTQTPEWQVSLGVHSVLSALQSAPSALTGFEQAPVAGSQVPAMWHWSDAMQVLAAPPAQAPAWQASPLVQALPSSQAAPLALTGFEQA